MPEKMRLQTAEENRQRWCRHGATDRARCRQQRQEKLCRWQSIALYGASSRSAITCDKSTFDELTDNWFSINLCKNC